jgi:glycosyltransferase involved in cell wall biosynthesis
VRNDSILIMLHCEQNTGYAIASLEYVFKNAALHAGYDEKKIFWSFSKVKEYTNNVYELPYKSNDSPRMIKELADINNISTILAFDLPYPTLIAKSARAAGVRKIVSYWGASMSSINKGMKLFLKQIEWHLRWRSRPHFFIFESIAMQRTAIKGRGVPENNTIVIPLGVDTVKFKPSTDKSYIKREFSIQTDRKIVFYSGHFEERKGVRTIVKAANHLANIGAISRIHFVLCGNRKGEEMQYLTEIDNKITRGHIVFAGYRQDIPSLMASSDIGVIVSSGWDSFTMSSVEMLASGLPLITSDVGGMPETTEPGVTGEIIAAGDYIGLAHEILRLVDNPSLINDQSIAARRRAEMQFEISQQIERIANVIK